MDPFIGQIILWPVPWVPEGWHLCDGTELPIQQYQALYSLIGTRYGGNGQSTFKLPDLRNKFAQGTMAMTQPGQSGGSASTPVNLTGQTSLSLANLPAHTHAAHFTGSAGGSASLEFDVTIPASTSAATASTPGSTLNLAATAGPSSKIFNDVTPNASLKPFKVTTTASLPTPTGTITVDPAGQVSPTPLPISVQGNVATQPPFLTLNYIIALQGIYPPRP
ncbi:MAG: phage tail protein [Candidatus Dactylopiibacterium carminicum]|uniref:Phage tail protein n=1 Tax=Candidatus Dactylopiibacterium carminicum TaxID=857335 RepID=A0A272EWH9_9RHOO|nr:tail fiber protein [Candidatus Dactylopiibacterium carminicum]KAF7600151.1 phage tail protein [Candidatus Dactylopiibacterium carminicum]PAS94020.1 MAG: phage tail protein [Candidatus Dactylopiibacterium carminicum]PAT00152.1 MAG: hypothetical protein BSR46_04505 [Candidatus Dactylopiibacterium carminicum]